MNKYLKNDEWCIIEEGFDPKRHRSSESIFSIGNGHMGQRANFEERYTGKSLQGSYVAGIYYPDKTRVGWWKNGYPEYFAKVINSPNWIGIDIQVNNQYLDLARCQTESFVRLLDMKNGILKRNFRATMPGGEKIKVEATRFLSMDDPEIGVVRYSVTSETDGIELVFTPYIDGDVKNEDSNYNEKFWNILTTEANPWNAYLEAQTKKLDFKVGYAMYYNIDQSEASIVEQPMKHLSDKYAGNSIKLILRKASTATLTKYVAVVSSLDYKSSEISKVAKQKANNAYELGFEKLLKSHTQCWSEKWAHADIVIKGDIEAQQGIRFNIFHLNQTYTGTDERLNVGPKGFTGEKYGGSTYWDTEAYCIPFYIATAPSQVSKNLLLYRYKHLQKAIENAHKLGFNNGAALFPMVTMNGEECHNEWEITFEEIHRNGAIAFAVYNFVRHTNDIEYLVDYGLELLIAISRFWSQRVNFSNEKMKYVILGVTGPNEYENNVNNNWYTNTMATWCLNYTLDVIEIVKRSDLSKFDLLVKKLNFEIVKETDLWKEIVEKMYYPVDPETGIFLQQEGYMDKDQLTVDLLDPSQRPINQNWSWDRILRSCFIKQADTLQGMYLFDDRYSKEVLKKHFHFYESRTVHESSLSPCVHSILAARLGDMEKAYELYLRTSRLDLDDYNNEVHEGLHITSMAGTWMAIVEGFGGKKINQGKWHFNPAIPSQWQEYSFLVIVNNQDLLVTVNKEYITFQNKGDKTLDVFLYDEPIEIKSMETIKQPLKK